MRKGITSIQIIYVLAIIIFVSVLIFGYNHLRGFSEDSEQLQIAEFENDLQSSIIKTSTQYGTVIIDKFEIPEKYSELCFVNTTNKSELPSAFVKAFPLIADSIETGENVFLVGDDMEAFNFEKIVIDDYVLCIPVKDGEVKVKMIGTGDSVVVKAIDVPSEEVEAGMVEEEIVISSNDFLATLEIPAGVVVSYTAKERNIAVQESPAPDNIDSMDTVGDIYEFQPVGTEFDAEVPLILSYNEDTADSESLIIMVDEGDGWKELESPFEINKMTHTLRSQIKCLARFVVVAPSRQDRDSSSSVMQDTDSGTSPMNFSCIDSYCYGTNKYVFPVINGAGIYNQYPIYCEGDFRLDLEGNAQQMECSTGWQMITDCRSPDGSMIPNCPYEPNETSENIKMNLSQIEDISEISFILDIDGDGNDEIVSINIGNSTKDGLIYIEPLYFHPTWHWKIFESDYDKFIETTSGTYNFGSNETYPITNRIIGKLGLNDSHKSRFLRNVDDSQRCIINGIYGEEMFIDYNWKNESFLGVKKLCIGYNGESLNIHPCTINGCNTVSLNQDVKVILSIQKNFITSSSAYMDILTQRRGKRPELSAIKLDKKQPYSLYWGSENAVDCQGSTNINYLPHLFNVTGTSGIYFYPDYYSPMPVVYTMTCTGPSGQVSSDSVSVDLEDIDAYCARLPVSSNYFEITENNINNFKVKIVDGYNWCGGGYESPNRYSRNRNEIELPSSSIPTIKWTCNGLGDGTRANCEANLYSLQAECGDIGIKDLSYTSNSNFKYVYGSTYPKNYYCGNESDCSSTLCSFGGKALNYSAKVTYTPNSYNLYNLRTATQSGNSHRVGYYTWTCPGINDGGTQCKAIRVGDVFLNEKSVECREIGVNKNFYKCNGDVLYGLGGLSQAECLDMCARTEGTSCCQYSNSAGCTAMSGTMSFIGGSEYENKWYAGAAPCYGGIYKNPDINNNGKSISYDAQYLTVSNGQDLYLNPMMGNMLIRADTATAERWCMDIGYRHGTVDESYGYRDNIQYIDYSLRSMMAYEDDRWSLKSVGSSEENGNNGYPSAAIRCFD